MRRAGATSALGAAPGATALVLLHRLRAAAHRIAGDLARRLVGRGLARPGLGLLHGRVNDGAAAWFRMDGTVRRSGRLMRIKAQTSRWPKFAGSSRRRRPPAGRCALESSVMDYFREA